MGTGLVINKRWLPILEVVAVYSAIVLYIWWLRFHAPLSWLGIVGVIVASHILRRETPGYLGFRMKYFRRSLGEFKLPLLGLVVTLVGAGFFFETLEDVSWRRAPFSFVFYCLWGLLQQYLLNGYFTNRFLMVFRNAGGSADAPIAAAFLFYGVHIPNWFLMVVTLAGGYFSAKAYLKHRNLFFLGLAHGTIGFLINLTMPDSITNHLYVGPRWFSG